MMSNRRSFLSVVASLGAATVVPRRALAAPTATIDDLTPATSWEEVRALFDLRPDRVHMSGLVFASHPRPVRDAIALHREELQRAPASYISHERWRLEGEVLRSASSYLGVKTTELAMT